MSVSAAPAALLIDAETPFDAAAVERVTLAAFGPGRFAKTAERLRERAPLAAGFVAREDGRVIGSVRLWSITVGGVPALFLGPIAVEASSRRAGTGAALVQACIDRARTLPDLAGVLLIGDPPYFVRFGFQPAPDVRLPGPADPRRIMWLPLRAAHVQGLAI
ncbi:N-acetyltransferase [Brevundimonas sp. S30B]|uniref:GNAT family N-acetyltransferase n=1 Tax=unclassified Brevundimonas TaxID=2622653 RepID=UPI00107269B8|nr:MULTISPECIES: N-acetyltransferase [unclassified Brevundimonas]QBX38608.1 N-acetyltransferase [Brevundimonas sp. MF30-B]TFW01199.1 N-acetyltransferase [Brevundimonas sp. S30B]